jgi:hypothetical protein
MMHLKAKGTKEVCGENKAARWFICIPKNPNFGLS